MLWYVCFCFCFIVGKLTPLERSFDPRLMHGTMLPSKVPLDELLNRDSEQTSMDVDNSPASSNTNQSAYHDHMSSIVPAVAIRVSRGNHPSIRKKDKQKAEKLKKLRAQHQSRSQYWQ